MLEIGSVIDGKYKVLSRIGQGGMSVVYLAMNEKANKFWAVKEVLKQDFLEFELDKKEMELMKRLKHSGLPSVVDVIEREEGLLIVMDYVEGQSMEEWLRESGPQPQEQVISWAKQLCRVLSYLHGQDPPVIYRDMKPANVIIKPDGNITLIDFGAAREYKPGKLRDTILLGTYGYAAPEQYEETVQSDARTDIYCLGVLLFQLLTGEAPQSLRPIREVNPGLSAGLEAIIQKCTRVKREERYQNCKELLYALEYYWEQDARYRARQIRKLHAFLLPVAAAVLLGMSAGVFGGMEAHVRTGTYEAFLLAAGNSTEKEEELNNYEKAILVDPRKERAYLELLREGFLDDQVLTLAESERLRAILMGASRGQPTHEALFQTNRKGYARFAYEAGIAYFYKFEERENKKLARNYLEIAASSKDLEACKAARARRLYAVADYYARIGIPDAAGDFLITYRQYWNDLAELVSGNLVEEDNERTALVMYEELVSQILSRARQFREAGVQKQDVLTQLEQVERHLEQDFGKDPLGDSPVSREEIAELKNLTQGARRVVESAYGEEDA